MKHYYGELIWDEDSDCVFRHDCTQISFEAADGVEPADGWAMQPG